MLLLWLPIAEVAGCISERVACLQGFGRVLANNRGKSRGDRQANLQISGDCCRCSLESIYA
ncbi:MAG: hypothetical protein HC890_10445 [Chloroflexaceae bacterium]|nr:hypothetical protein [Chloroflexaceae bacterium]